MALPLAALLPPGPSANAPLNTFPPAPASVAVLGRLPASAPVHLALGSVARNDGAGDADSVALILAKSGSEWASALLSDGMGGDGDAWFAQEGGKAGVLHRANKVVIKYLPTLAHLSLFLSLLHYAPIPAPGSEPHPARLERRPFVVILHEPSSWFVDWHAPADPEDEPLGEPLRQEPTWKPKARTTIASLSRALSLATSSITSFNASLQAHGLPPTQLVVLDSLAGDLALPILPPRDDGKKGPDIAVRTMASRLFDWVATVEKDEDGDDAAYAVQLDHHILLPAVRAGDPAQRKLSFREDLDTTADRWRPTEDGRGVWRWLG